MKLIDSIPFPVLIVLALLLGTAPMGAQPHLLEKIDMLMAGVLVKPLDIFDLFLHSAPIVLLVIKLIHFFNNKRIKDTENKQGE